MRNSTGGTSHHALTGFRLGVAVVLVLLLPVTLAVAALTYRPPDPPPTGTGSAFAGLSNTLEPHTDAQLDRSWQLRRMVRTLAAPALIAAAAIPGATGPLPSLVLVPRPRPYTLAELRTLVPEAFAGLTGPLPAGALLLTANLEVPAGASLVIDEQTPDVRLLSSAAGFVTIISRGTVTVAGKPQRPVRISSWDPTRATVDRELIDGRSFILQLGNRMDADHAIFEYLGFNLGLSSGVTWNSSGSDALVLPGVRPGGKVTSSVFRANYFGAYTRQAQGMLWSGNTFADNVAYGFDPHDFSDNFLVENNVAYGNGKHGFIFSHGCTGNVLRSNDSHDNAGHGFMIDDGRSADGGGEKARINDSNNNQVVDNLAYGNGGSGVEIEGGKGNVVSGNQISGNYIGVRVKNMASVVVRDNTIAGNLRYGVDVLDPGGTVSVAGNTISGTWGAVNLADGGSAVVGVNSVSDVSTFLVVGGVAVRDHHWVQDVAAFVRWNPLVVLWSLVIGVPLVVMASRLGGSALRGLRFGRRPVSPVGVRRHRVPAA